MIKTLYGWYLGEKFAYQDLLLSFYDLENEESNEEQIKIEKVIAD